MRQSFSYTLLITSLFLVWNCKVQYVQSSFEYRNSIVSDSIMAVDSQLLQVYLPYKQIIDEDMSRVISVSAQEMVKNKPESNLTNFLRSEEHTSELQSRPHLVCRLLLEKKKKKKK